MFDDRAKVIVRSGDVNDLRLVDCGDGGEFRCRVTEIVLMNVVGSGDVQGDSELARRNR